MLELLRTTDIALIAAARAYLKAEGIEMVVFDQHTSIIEGSLGMFIPQRLMVAAADFEAAREILILAGVLDGPGD